MRMYTQFCKRKRWQRDIYKPTYIHTKPPTQSFTFTAERIIEYDGRAHKSCLLKRKKEKIIKWAWEFCHHSKNCVYAFLCRRIVIFVYFICSVYLKFCFNEFMCTWIWERERERKATFIPWWVWKSRWLPEMDRKYYIYIVFFYDNLKLQSDSRTHLLHHNKWWNGRKKIMFRIVVVELKCLHH